MVINKYLDMEYAQREICERYGALYFPSPNNMKVGIANDAIGGVIPINGLRNPPEKGTTGWYIWAGETLSQADDYFIPLHVSHLQTRCPSIIKYLCLSPGWRFLIAEGYEDAWYDKSLLSV